MEHERLSEFVRDDYARVVAALAFACADAGRAEDAVQEALASAWQHRGQIDHLRPWVAKAALNQLRSTQRRLGAERRAQQRAGRIRSSPSEGEPVLPGSSLMEALRSLPARQREIVVLHYLLDMSVADTASACRVTDGTVKTQLHRARETLRLRLTGEAHHDEEADHVG